MGDIALFSGISSDSVEEMMTCFKAEIKSFRKGAAILEYSSSPQHVCVLLSGRAHLSCISAEGDEAFLEDYGENDIFGEVFTLPGDGYAYTVVADSDCRAMFIPFAAICGRCEKACAHHSRITENLFTLAAKKAQMLALRINILSRRSVRGRLAAYLEYLRTRLGSDSFQTEMSLTRLADYLCVDRTSLMRELRSMKEEGLLASSGRDMKILAPLSV